MNRKRTLQLLAIKLGVSVFIGWLVWRTVKWEEILRLLRQCHAGWMSFALGCGMVSVFFTAWRWRVMADGRIGLMAAWRLTLISTFYGTFLPGGLTGDVAKGAILASEDRSHRNAASAMVIVADRFIGVASMLFLTVLACLWSLWQGQHGEAWRGVTLWTGGTLVLMLSGAALLASSGFRRLLCGFAMATLPHKISAAFISLLHHLGGAFRSPARLVRAVLLSLVVHGFCVVQCLAITRSLGLNTDLPTCFVVYSLLALTTLIPVTMSGVGVRDWLGLHLFASAGSSGEAGVAVSMLLLGVGVAIALIGGAIQLACFLIPKPAEKESTSSLPRTSE
jgi:uncharacterized protein (TIRG00374 family)